jgi:hypothetical protein
MSYVPTPRDLPGEQYLPSNSTEGWSFIEHFCSHCARDRACREGPAIDECDDNEKCEILAASFRGEAVEWRQLPGGRKTCVSFVPAGTPVPPERCLHTADMFAAEYP